MTKIENIYQLTADDAELDLRKDASGSLQVELKDCTWINVKTRANSTVQFTGNVRQLCVSGASSISLYNLRADFFRHLRVPRERRGKPTLKTNLSNIQIFYSSYNEPIFLHKTFCEGVEAPNSRVQLNQSLVDRLRCKHLSLSYSNVISILDCDTIQDATYSLTAPLRGPFYLWKKAKAVSEDNSTYEVLILLYVPSRARRFGTGKIRVSSAFVRGFYSVPAMLHSKKLTKLPIHEAYSDYSSVFCYKKNQLVKPSLPFTEKPVSCASGLHGFLNPLDAALYTF